MTTIERRKLGLTHWNEKSAGGYTLYSPQTGGGRIPLIDDGGELVHEWNMPVRPGRDAVILPNDNLGYNGSHNKSVNLYPPWDIWHGGHFMEANRKSDIVWEYEDPYAHHDAQWLNEGLLYILGIIGFPILMCCFACCVSIFKGITAPNRIGFSPNYIV